jgi:predicted nucleic acid-binding protein
VILLDTNVVSAVMLQRPDPEVVAWLDRISRRQKLELALHRLITEMIQERIAPLDARAANQAALFAAQRKMQGRSVDLLDTLIAGIALAHEAQLATRNVRHFSDTTISLINPFATDPQYG